MLSTIYPQFTLLQVWFTSLKTSKRQKQEVCYRCPLSYSFLAYCYHIKQRLYIAFPHILQILVDRNSVVDVTTHLGMDGPGIECRWGARFSSPVQTVPGAHLVCCKICTRSLSRAKADGAWRLPPTPSSV
jgi:hypothetical protein